MHIQHKITSIFRTKVSGLSLLEVLTVLIIIGLTSLVVVNNLSPTINKVKRKEAHFQLKHIDVLEQSYMREHDKFSSDLDEIGFAQRLLKTQDGDAYYKIELIDASLTGYKARATSVIDFNKNGTMDVWEIDQTGKITNTVKD